MTTQQVGRAASPHITRVLRWMFVNRQNGRVTIAQWPNVPLWAFVVFSVVSAIVHPSGGTAELLRVLAFLALVLWGAAEVARGVNPFRRILGAAVLLATVANLALS